MGSTSAVSVRSSSVANSMCDVRVYEWKEVRGKRRYLSKEADEEW